MKNYRTTHMSIIYLEYRNIYMYQDFGNNFVFQKISQHEVFISRKNFA